MANQSYPKRYRDALAIQAGACNPTSDVARNTDPTRNEMLTFLAGFYPGEAEQFDREEAIYWFAHDWHSGQWSELYSALSTSEYRPGAMTTGPQDPDMYDALVDQFGG